MLDRLPNKKQTLKGLGISAVGAVLFFLCISLLVAKRPFGIQPQTDMMTITMTLLEIFSIIFLIYSFYRACVAAFFIRSVDWQATHGISMPKTLLVCLLSVFNNLFVQEIIALNLRDFSHNLVFTAMMLVQVITVIYAGLDLLNFNNLRWFLRTWPYSATGIFFIRVAFHQLGDSSHSLLLEDKPVTNTILSFITITFFVQVFNERFCKKEEDQLKAQNRNRPADAGNESMMERASDEAKTAMEWLRMDDETCSYMLVNPLLLRFSYTIRKRAKGSILYSPDSSKAEGILLYDPKTKRYLGYLWGDSLGGFRHHKKTLLLPCANGEQYDKTGEEHLAPSPIDGMVGTCAIDDHAKSLE